MGMPQKWTWRLHQFTNQAETEVPKLDAVKKGSFAKVKGATFCPPFPNHGSQTKRGEGEKGGISCFATTGTVTVMAFTKRNRQGGTFTTS